MAGDITTNVSGDATGGFMVEMHDGDVFKAFGLLVEDAEAAVKAALALWHGETPAAPVAAPEAPVADNNGQ